MLARVVIYVGVLTLGLLLLLDRPVPMAIAPSSLTFEEGPGGS